MSEIEVKKSYVSEVHRALVVLGFSEQERAQLNALDTFSRWIDELSFDEERKATWIQLVIARFGTAEGTGDLRTIGQQAMDLVKMQQRFFPPRARTGLDDGPDLPVQIDFQISPHAYAELQAWRSAAQAYGWESPLDIRGNSADNAEDERKRWQGATERDTPLEAKHRIDSYWNEIVNQQKAWESETGCMTATGAGELIRQLRERVHVAEQKLEILREHGAFVGKDMVYMSSVATNPLETIRDLQNKLTEKDSEWQGHLERAVDGCERQWREKTGCASAKEAGELISEANETSYKLRAKLDELSIKLSERDRDLLYASTEIDAIRNAAKVLGIAPDQSKELAKLRADFESKCREVQTERERADMNERESAARRVILDKINKALGANFEHESLPEHVSDLRTLERSSDNIIDQVREILRSRPGESIISAAKRVVAQSTIDNDRYDAVRKALGAVEGETLLDAAKRAIISLPKPEKVEPGQRWAFVMTCTREDTISTSRAVQFIDASGCGYAAFCEDIASGYFLGT